MCASLRIDAFRYAAPEEWSSNRTVGGERNPHDPASEIGVGALRQGVAEQALLHIKTHEAVRDIDADQTGMSGIAFHQSGKVSAVVGHGCVAVFHGAPDQRPIRPGS